MAEGRYNEAEPHIERAIERAEAEFGYSHLSVGRLLSHLGEVYYEQGRYSETQRANERALVIYEKEFGLEHPEVGALLNNLAAVHDIQGQDDEAIRLRVRSLAMIEKDLGPDHPNVANSLDGLAFSYMNQGRLDEAEPLFARSLAIRERVFGPSHPDVTVSLAGLATLQRDRQRYGEAESLQRRILEIREQALGPDHPNVADALASLAKIYRHQGDDGAALPLYQRALSIREKALGPHHLDVARSLAGVGLLYVNQGRHEEAAELFERDIAITETVFGPDHPEVAIALHNLAEASWSLGRRDLALKQIRRAAAIRHRRALQASGERSVAGLNEQRSARYLFMRHLSMIFELSLGDRALHGARVAEAFETGQFANATGAAVAVSRMAARFASGDDELAALVRERQDATERWRRLDQALATAASWSPHERDTGHETAMREEQIEIDERVEAIDAWLSAAFPEFAELTASQPVSLAEAQALLAEDEALLAYLLGADDESFAFVVRRDQALLGKVIASDSAMTAAVAQLRQGLDPIGIRTLDDLPVFDRELAHLVYLDLIGTFEDLLEGVRHLIVVADGALQSLPLGVLLTEEHAGEITSLADYRKLPWLARRYAITTLPSVASLSALRSSARRTKASKPFLGIGDPRLEGEMGSGRGVNLASLFTSRGVADVDAVRELPSLPDTANELQSLARTLGAGEDALILGTAATETRLKEVRLNDHRVLAFATHGLVAGDLSGLSEPALVLTPPTVGSERDDGLLTASEVAQLELDADWVILSACNTAASDGTPGAEGLSGLAKAFFFAGSRALLVSHWPVASQAAVQITTRMLEKAVKPEVGRAEAHRRAMLSLIDDDARPYFAHPSFWAAFTVVGEGR